MLLIHPPVAKPCEAPPGIAYLAGAMRQHGHSVTLLDANLEGLLDLLAAPLEGADTWSRQALHNRAAHLNALRSPALFRNLDRYKRAVSDLGRVLDLAGGKYGTSLTFANFEDPHHGPQSSADLLRAAQHPEQNPFYPWFSRRLTALLEQLRPPLIGFSLNFLSQAVTTFAMIGFLRQRFPGLPLVLGGGLLTSWMRQPEWRDPFRALVDHLIPGPGEMPLLALLGEQAGEPHSLPDFGPLKDNPYLAPGFVLPFAASRGCWWNRCSFCPERAEGNPYSSFLPQQIRSDLDRLILETQPALLHLLDSAVHPAVLQMLAERPDPTPWYGFVRLTEHLADGYFCRELRRSGCIMLKLGIESGDQGVLDRMEKGIDLAMASRALAALKEAGIATYIYLLFGTPAESLPEARKTLAFARSHADAITFLNLAIFNLPALEAASGPLETRPFYAGDLSLYRDFIHPKGWNRSQVRSFLEREFKRDAAILPILHRNPPVFTSNHAPFLQQGCHFC
ncbi:MAG: radical SAM protein [Deltaproteobacteria bacterium]|nr:radical SAM protein [Deltaproteobacteria bacterium]